MKRRFLKGAVGGRIELKTLEGREMLVAPVIALVEGVITASNSSQAELVLAEEFGKIPQAWNGRFAMYDHPTTDVGEKTSANSPTIVDALRIGTVFNSRLEQKKLKMDVWIDTKKVETMSEETQELVESIRRGDIIEVSVGVFTAAEEKVGTHNGQRYSAIWREIIPDHLALLPKGTTGACSIEMGCGTRAAAEGGKVAKKSSWNEAKRVLLQQFIAAQEDTSDRDLRMALEQALFAQEPGFMGVVDVFSEAKQVVYAVAPEGETHFFRRDFTVGEDQTVTLGGTPEEVKQVTRYEAAAAVRTAACGCAVAPKGSPTTGEPMDLAKKNRAAAALTKLAARFPRLYTASDADLFANASEERLKALEKAADDDTPADEKYKPGTTDHPPTAPPVAEPGKAPAVPKPQAPETPATPAPPNAPDLERDKDRKAVPAPAKEKSEEEFLASAPESIRQIVSEHKAASAAKKDQLVAALKTAQSAYTEDELKALDIKSLEKLSAITIKPDFSGLGPQRVAAVGGQKEEVPPPPSLKERLLAQGKKTA